MKYFKHTVRWAVPVLLLLVWTGCDSNTALDEPALKHSGEDIFRGLIFGQGPVADLFPELWSKEALADVVASLDDEARAHYHAELEKTRVGLEAVIADIKVAQPDYFTRFGAAVQSGDHLRVEAALDEAFDQVYVGLAAQEGLTVEAFRAQVGAMMPEDAAAIGKGSNLVLALVCVLVLNVYMQVNIERDVNITRSRHFWREEPTQRKGDSRLAHDVYIDMIVQRLN